MVAPVILSVRQSVGRNLPPSSSCHKQIDKLRQLEYFPENSEGIQMFLNDNNAHQSRINFAISLLITVLPFLILTSCTSDYRSVKYSSPVPSYPLPITPAESIKVALSSVADKTASCLQNRFPGSGMVSSEYSDTPTLTVLIQENGLASDSRNIKTEYRLDLEFLLNEIPARDEKPNDIRVFPRLISKSSIILVGRGVRVNNNEGSMKLLEMERLVAECLKSNSQS